MGELGLPGASEEETGGSGSPADDPAAWSALELGLELEEGWDDDLFDDDLFDDEDEDGEDYGSGYDGAELFGSERHGGDGAGDRGGEGAQVWAQGTGSQARLWTGGAGEVGAVGSAAGASAGAEVRHVQLLKRGGWTVFPTCVAQVELRRCADHAAIEHCLQHGGGLLGCITADDGSGTLAQLELEPDAGSSAGRGVTLRGLETIQLHREWAQLGGFGAMLGEVSTWDGHCDAARDGAPDAAALLQRLQRQLPQQPPQPEADARALSWWAASQLQLAGAPPDAAQLWLATPSTLERLRLLLAFVEGG